jgi:hypothetical protein
MRTGVVAVVAVVMAVVSGPARAEEPQEQPDEDTAFRDAQFENVWAGYAEARPLGPVVGIPGEQAVAVPYTRSYIDSTPGRSEGFAGLAYAAEVIEEGILNTTGTAGHIGQVNPVLIRCGNPDAGFGLNRQLNVVEGAGGTLVGGEHLPTSLGNVVEGAAEGLFNAAGARESADQAVAAVQDAVGPILASVGKSLVESSGPFTAPSGAPNATVDCPSRFGVASKANSGLVMANQLSLGGGIGDSTIHFDPGTQTLIAETKSTAADWNVAGLIQLPVFSSTLHAELKAGAEEPTISYTMRLASLRVAGKEVLGLGPDGLTISGSNLAPADVLANFRDQLVSAAGAVDTLATLNLRIVEPTIEKRQQRWRISAPALLAVARPGEAVGKLNEQIAQVQDALQALNLPLSLGVNLAVGPGRLGDHAGLRLGWAEVELSALKIEGAATAPATPVAPAEAPAGTPSIDIPLTDVAGVGVIAPLPPVVAAPAASDEFVIGGDLVDSGDLIDSCTYCSQVADSMLVVLLGTVAVMALGVFTRRRLLMA